MTNSQKLAVRSSEIRSRLNDLSGMATAELTDELRSETDALTTEYRDVESQYRAALISEGEAEQGAADAGSVTEDAEHRARRELRGKSRLSRYISAAVNARAVDGPEAEFSAACGCPGTVPFEMFDEQREAVEQRAVTPGPASARTPFGPIVPALFQRSAMAWLGIDMPTVGVGDSSYPVLGTSVTAGVVAESADAAETAGQFTVTSARPRRVTGAFRFTREDAARLSGMEEALRMNLGQVVGDQLDNQGVNGSASGDGTLKGLFAILDNPTAPAASAEDFARYVTAVASHVDGTFSVDLAGIRALVGPKTYQHMSSVFRHNSSDMTAEAWATTRTGGLRVSPRIADPASNIQQAIIRRANPAGDRVAVMPVWQGLEIIRDPYTGAKKGEVVVTAVALVGDVVVLRDGAFVQDSFRLA